MSNLINEMFNDLFGRDLEKFQRDIDSFFDDAYKEAEVPSFKLSKGSYPKVNIVEKEDCFQITAATPGLLKKDLELKYKEGMLSIIGKSSQKTSEESSKFICRELKKSNFIRSFRVDPSKVDVENITCSLELGELSITVPKKTQETQTDSFDIKID